MLFRMGVTVAPAKAEDSRRCIFCQSQGDATADGPARLLNFDVDKWVHLNCALWSNVVYEVQSGALMHLDDVLQNNLMQICIVCEKPAGTIKCYKPRCTNCYHLMCAVKDGCVFYKDKVIGIVRKINIYLFLCVIVLIEYIYIYVCMCMSCYLIYYNLIRYNILEI